MLSPINSLNVTRILSLRLFHLSDRIIRLRHRHFAWGIDLVQMKLSFSRATFLALIITFISLLLFYAAFGGLYFSASKIYLCYYQMLSLTILLS